MKISAFVWTEDRIDHIGRHGVEPEEFEEVCVISFPGGKGYPVAAREMTESEKQRYSRWKKP